MAKDEYGIYRKPATSSIAACLGIAAAIFFGAYSMNLKGRLTEVSHDNASLRKELGDYKSKLLNAEVNVQTLQAELSDQRLKSGLATVSPVNEVAPKHVLQPVAEAQAEMQKSVEALQVKSEPVRSEIISASATVKSLPETNTVKIEPAPVKDNAELEQAAVLSGEILRYEPDTRKVYLSLGSIDSGIKPGKRFTVWRDDKYVTDIRVTQVFGVTSTCEVAGPTPIGIRTGDVAKLAVRPANGL